MASVLFSDVVGFTALSSRIVIEDLLVFVTTMFNYFDKLSVAYKVYKVETIGATRAHNSKRNGMPLCDTATYEL
jgi:hypothetical protein